MKNLLSLAGWGAVFASCFIAANAGAQAGATLPTFQNVSVHDPSVIKVGDTFYVFGSHLASARSTDLMKWTQMTDSVSATNPLFLNGSKNVYTELAETFAWANSTTLWAPDVRRLADGKYYMYYDACQGDAPRSALGIAVANSPEGPYVNKGVILKSGMWGQASPDGTIYDPLKHPNTVDPNVFFDNGGRLWMVYGSYSGGIFIMQMDPATGQPYPNQGYGKRLMGGNHARIEGAYILYSPATSYYYLFTSFGGLDANGGYNMRVARSTNPDGPYYDAQGNNMANVKADPNKPLFDDASIAPYGVKMMGNFLFERKLGEAGTGIGTGYVSAGHNSARYEAATNQYFLIFHTRFPGQGEYHELRVHEMFINDDGWPVAAPLRYVPLSKSATTIFPTVTSADTAGAYKMVNHGKDISATVKPSVAIRLESGGTVTGAGSGTWTHKGNNNVSIVIDGVAYSGVLSRQWNPNANAFAVTFTAQSQTGVSLWGIRTGS